MSREVETDLTRTHDELLSLHGALQTELERYRALFDNAPVALVVTDHQLAIVDANAAAAELLGTQHRFLLRKPLSVFVDLRDRKIVRRWSVALETRVAQNVRMRRRTGVTFDGTLTATPIRDEIHWSIVDRTDEAQAELRLWELNRELESRAAQQAAEVQSIVAQLPVGVAVVRPDGSLGWTNGRAEAILGELPETIARVDVRDEAGELLSLARHPASRALAGETVASQRVQVVRCDGSTAVVDVAAMPVASQAGGAVLVLTDVTERARRERADAEFVENAAHQLRTPITAIAGSVAALLAGAADEPEARERFLRHIAREAVRMGGLADSLLTLAGVQRGRKFRLETMQLHGLVNDLAPSLLRPQCTLSVDISPALYVVGDRELLAHALGNVLANAVEHAEREVRVTASGDGAEIDVEIRDDGPGVPVEARDRIFERFFRAEGGERKGSGLGLAIARAAAEATGGTLALVDEAGPGATFRFRLAGARRL